MTRKWKVFAIPLAVGALLFWVLLSLNRRADSGSAGDGKSAPTPAKALRSGSAPANKIHETASLEQELKQNPNHPPILLRLAELAREDGKRTEALKYLQRAVEADPNNADARLEFGRALYDAGQPEAAIAETSRILASQPKHVDALYNLGAIYGNLGQTAQARQYFERAVAADAASESGRKSKDALTKLGR